MTKKDYILIAGAIKQAKIFVKQLNAHELTDKFLAGVSQTERNITNALASENPRFDEVKFKKACNLE